MKYIASCLAALYLISSSLSAQTSGGKALSLDGDGDYMFVGIALELQILGDVTVEAWVCINSYPDTSYSFPFADIVINAGPSPDIEENNALYTLGLTIDSLFDCFHENGAGVNNSLVSKSKLPPGAWLHLAEVRDVTAQTYAVYINGVLDTIGVYPNNPTGGSNSAFFVGSGPGALIGEGLDFHGIIDEVRVWNRKRTQEELQATMHDTLGPEYYQTADSGLAGYWRFDALENLGTANIRDFSVNGNHGTLMGDAHLVPSGFGTATIVLAADSVISAPGDTVSLPITVTFPQDSSYSSAEINFGGFQGQLEFLGLDTAASLIGSAGWTYQVNNTDTLLYTAFAGAQSISGADTLFFLKFAVPAATPPGFIPITIGTALFDTGGTPVVRVHGGVDVRVTAIDDFPGTVPEEYRLFQNHPNPFNPSTTISYQLPKAEYVELTIYNLLGQEVRKLVSEHQSAGHHTINWDGRDERGRQVGSGVYLYRLSAGNDFVETRKMVLIR